MFEVPKKLLSEFMLVRRRVGTVSALRLGALAIRQDPGLLGRGTAATPGSIVYQTKRTDADERWELISARIDPDARNAVDLGCNRGAITRRAAEMGLFAIGIDVDDVNVRTARLTTELPNCHYFGRELGPDDVAALPSFDVTFLLAVYHHWGRQYGWEQAETMLRTLSTSTGQLFVETPNDLNSVPTEPIDEPVDDREAIHRYFAAVLPEADVDFVGETDWIVEADRTDLIFEIRGS